MEDEYDNDTILTPEEYLKNLDIEDFLNCNETKEILEQESYQKFEIYLKPKLEEIFEKYAKSYSCFHYLKNDENGIKNSDIFSEIVYDNMNKDYDVTIFYDCPSLAKKLIS